MPIGAAIGTAAGLGGGLASGAQGKKAANQANKIAQQQLGIQQQAFGQANQQLGAAGQYYNALLKGGQAAVEATGPYASLIGQNAAGARTAIQAITPRGGEQNLAMAQNYNTAANNIARLYAGMQPLAAQGLTQIGGAYLGAAQPSIPTAGGISLGEQGMANQGAAGYGSLLYNSLNKMRAGVGGNNYGSLGDLAAAGAPASNG